MKDWKVYKTEFTALANKNSKSDMYISKWLEYAKVLYNHKMPIIYDQRHLCKLLGYIEDYVYAASNNPESFYHEYHIPKKSGGFRKIDEPLPGLKDIQRWILDQIVSKIEVSPYAKAYVKGLSVRDNARFHRGQKYVLSLDLSDFFGHITDWMVYRIFVDAGYCEAVAMMLTRLCCLNHCLPQGAPTSAALSNIVMKEFDGIVGEFCKERKIRYTRYADDMTFSGDFEVITVIRFVRKLVKKIGFELNSQKTRVRGRGQRQEVTGVVVNEKLQLSKDTRRGLRQAIYYIEKYGLQSHIEKIGEKRKYYLEHLIGQVNYALFINPKDKEIQRYKQVLIDIKKAL